MRKESPSNTSPEVVQELKEIMESTKSAISAGDVFQDTAVSEPVVEFLRPLMHVENSCVPPQEITFMVHDLSNSGDDRVSVHYANLNALPIEVRRVVHNVLSLMNGSGFIPDLPEACKELAERVNKINEFGRAHKEQREENLKWAEEMFKEKKNKFKR